MLLYLKYSSGSCSLVAKGLVIVWLLVVGATSGQGCGGTYTASYGRITSPGYPGNYPKNADCLYHIVQPIGYKINLVFIFFDVEQYVRPCSPYNDFLKIIDGTRRTYNCGYWIPSPITSKGDNIWLHFHSDLYVEKTGFAVNYTTEYAGDSCSEPGTVSVGNTCFVWYNYPITWHEAKTTCSNTGTGRHLAVVNSQIKQNAIKDMLWDLRSQPSSVWIGAKKEGAWKWKWVTGDWLVYSSWKYWPYNWNTCASMEKEYYYDWKRKECTPMVSFICQYEIPIPTTLSAVSMYPSSTPGDQTSDRTIPTALTAVSMSTPSTPGAQTSSTTTVTVTKNPETDMKESTSDAVSGTTQIPPRKENGVADDNGTPLKQGEQNQEDTISTGAGIGIGIGIVVALGLAVIGIVCYCKRIRPGIFVHKSHKSKKRSKSATPVFSNVAYSTESSNLSFNDQANATNPRSGQMSSNLNNQAPNGVHHNDVYAIPLKNRKLNSPNPEEFVENDFHASDEGNSTNPHVILTNNADVDFEPEDEYGVTPVRNGKTGCDPNKRVTTAENYGYSYVVGQLNLDDVDFEPEDEYGTASGYMEKHDKNKTETDVIFVDNDIYESG